MSSQVGLWIDNREAFIVFIEGKKAISKKILSNVEKHVKIPLSTKSLSPFGNHDVIAEDKIERNFRVHLKKYYDKVTHFISDAEMIFIMGPGPAKVDFKKYLQKSSHKPEPVIEVETADKMTETKIISKVKKHFIH